MLRLLLLLIAAQLAAADPQPTDSVRIGAGVSIANHPFLVNLDIIAGTRPRLAFYLSLGSSYNSKSEAPNYYGNISIDEAEGWGDERRKSIDASMSIGWGAIYRVTRELAVQGGAFYLTTKNEHNYHDPSGILGGGSYWVGGSKKKVLGLRVGALYLVHDNWSISGGYQTFDNSFSAGLAYLITLRDAANAH